jgi:hypothetical protein
VLAEIVEFAHLFKVLHQFPALSLCVTSAESRFNSLQPFLQIRQIVSGLLANFGTLFG